MLLDFEKNRTIEDVYLKDVVYFCLQTDVCKTLNLSFLDLISLDLPTYEFIKEEVRKDNEVKTKALEKSQRDLETRQQQQLTGVKSHAKRK